jgi:WD40 repeat protein
VNIWGGRKKLRIESDAAISGLAWMHSGVLLAGQKNRSGTLGLFHTRTEDDNHLADTGGPISGVSWSEQWGVIVGHNDNGGLWELWSNDIARRLVEYQGHSQGIVNIAANPRGDMVATISLDRTLRVWELTMPTRQPSPMVSRTPSPSRRGGPPGSGRSTPITFLR